MNQTVLEKQPTLKHRKTIVSLAVVALVFVALHFIFDFVSINDNGLIFVFPLPVFFVPNLISLVPYVLLLIYLLKLFPKNKAAWLMPVIFGLIALKAFRVTLESLLLGVDLHFPVSFKSYLFFFSFCVAMCCIIKGLSNKIIKVIFAISVLIVVLIAALWCWPFIWQLFYYLENEFASRDHAIFNLFVCLFNLLGRIGRVLLCVALLMFGLESSTACKK